MEEVSRRAETKFYSLSCFFLKSGGDVLQHKLQIGRCCDCYLLGFTDLAGNSHEQSDDHNQFSEVHVCHDFADPAAFVPSNGSTHLLRTQKQQLMSASKRVLLRVQPRG